MALARDTTFVAVGQSLIKRDIRGYRDPAFRGVLDIVDRADLAFTNLETTIRGSYGGWPTKPSYFGASDPVVLDALKEFGFNMLSLSNNHAFDLGPNGVLSTMDEVGRRGFCFAGLGHDLTGAARAGYLETPVGQVALVAMDGGPSGEHVYAKDASDRVPSRPGVNRLRINSEIVVSADELAKLRAIKDELGHDRQRHEYRCDRAPEDPNAPSLDFYGLQFATGDRHQKLGTPDAEDVARNLAGIRDAKANADFVVAYLHHHHWEAAWEDIPDWEREFAHACVDAGANAYVSHGVPLPQGIEIYDGAPIFYSLGNFIFHSFSGKNWFHDDIWRSVVATCRFGADGCVAGIEFDPIVIGGKAALDAKDFSRREAPHLAQDAYGEEVIARISDLSKPLGSAIEVRDGRGYLNVPGGSG